MSQINRITFMQTSCNVQKNKPLKYFSGDLERILIFYGIFFKWEFYIKFHEINKNYIGGFWQLNLNYILSFLKWLVKCSLCMLEMNLCHFNGGKSPEFNNVLKISNFYLFIFFFGFK